MSPSFDHAESLDVLTVGQALQCGVDTILGGEIIGSKSSNDEQGYLDLRLPRDKRVIHRQFKITYIADHAVWLSRSSIPCKAFQPCDI